MKRSDLSERARSLRFDSTRPERRLWRALRDRRLGGWKWKRQVPRGPYIVDFLCVEAALVVELDGGQHADQQAYDDRRTAFLEAQGLRALRFWNGALLEDHGVTGVCDAILAACSGEAPHPSSPRKRGEA
jgi:very-short-patch-repair endonuclease